MHPGPMNRGVEITREVADSAASLVDAPGARRPGGADGGALRPARRPSAAAGGVSGREGRTPRRRRPATRRRPARPRRARGRPRRGHRRAPRRARARRRDRRARRRARRAGGRRGRRCRRLHAAARLDRPARAPAHPGPGAQGGPRDRHRGRRRGRVHARSSPCRTPTRWSTPPRCCARCTSSAATRRCVAVGFLAAISLGQQGEQLAQLGALADAGAVGFSDDGRPVLSAGLLRRALQYAAITGRVLSLHCEDTSLCARGRDARGRRLARELGLRGYPAMAESTMVARDLRIAALRGPAAAPLPPARRASRSRRCGGRARGGVDVSAEASPHHLLLTDEEVLALDPHLKMSPPLAAERAPPGAGRGAARRHGRLRRHRPRAARARSRRRCRSRPRRTA